MMMKNNHALLSVLLVLALASAGFAQMSETSVTADDGKAADAPDAPVTSGAVDPKKAGDVGSTVVSMFLLAPKKKTVSYIGVAIEPLTKALAAQVKLPAGIGVVVTHAGKDGPAAKAGLKKYDILHKIGDQLVINQSQFSVLVRLNKAGSKVKLTIIRGGVSKVLDVTVGEHDVYDYQVKLSGPLGSAEEGRREFLSSKVGKTHTITLSGKIGDAKPLNLKLADGDKGAATSSSAMTVKDDDDRTFQLSRKNKGQWRLIVTDKGGKELFSGPVKRDGRGCIVPNDKMPKGVQNSLKKINRMLEKMKVEIKSSPAPVKGKVRMGL